MHGTNIKPPLTVYCRPVELQTPLSRVSPKKLTGPQSRSSTHFLEPECSLPLPHSQAPTTRPYPEPVQFSPCLLMPLLKFRSILILYFHLRLGFQSGTFHSGLPTNTMYAYHLSSSRPTISYTATRFGLDCRGIESRWRRDIPHSSGPALGSTHPPVYWVPGHYRG
jgi:hypothetical protein